MVMYRSLQDQMNNVLGFGMSFLFLGIMFGIVKSFVSISLEPEEESPGLIPQTKKGSDESTQKYGVWDSYLDPGAAYAEARKLRQQGWAVRVTDRKTPDGKKYYVWIGRKKTPPELLPQVLIADGERVPSQYHDLIAWIREPLPAYSLSAITLLPQTWPAVVPEAKGHKIDEVLKQLKEGVEGVQSSHNFRQFLLTMSKFHDYSIGNLILIAMQRPDAIRVAGFNTWKDLGRWVKKGEKGIAILAPVMPPKPKPEEEEEETEEELRSVHFKVVYVFDIGQTEGKPLPEVEVPTLTGEVNEELFIKVMTLARAQGVEVSFEARPHQGPAIKGTYSGKSIWIRPEEPQAQQLKTLLHEIAHYYSEGVFRIPRRDAETIAESAAFAVGAHFGFDTGTRSFPYVALWSEDKKVLEQNLAAIRKVTTIIIGALE